MRPFEGNIYKQQGVILPSIIGFKSIAHSLRSFSIAVGQYFYTLKIVIYRHCVFCSASDTEMPRQDAKRLKMMAVFSALDHDLICTRRRAKNGPGLRSKSSGLLPFGPKTH
ncbi:hypothetical protein DWB67_01145 [Paracoccus sp. JM45]|nr:hypothetical protein DWB67_01145 [Paracoccus sp. JM45]